MGSGAWSSATYSATTARKVATGTTYAYSAATAAAPPSARKAHEDLDPKKVAGSASPLAGQTVRESRDNADHPTSTPLAVFFDETGSMGNTPRVLQTKLTGLFGLLLRKGYVEHPQIMMGGYGDHVYDRVPLQVSQFESDNRIDDALDNIYLESGGGGNGGESQWLAWYYLAFHTATDAWDKRDKKGYAFFIGDEWVIEPDADAAKEFIGDGEPLCEMTREAIVKALLEKWDAYVLVINNMAAKGQRSVENYSKLFGSDRVLVVENENAIAETIALVVGTSEGVIDLDEGEDDLRAIGTSEADIKQATSALAVRKNLNGTVTVGKAPADLDASDSDDVARL